MSIPNNVRNFYTYTPNSFQRYGAARAGGRRHRGTDLSHSTKSGTIVPALIAGRVTGKLSPANWHGFGYQITTEGKGPDGRTYRVSYAHGARPQSTTGSFAQGHPISTEGTTGSTTGPCVHVEVFDVARGVFIDPMILIKMVLNSSGGTGGEVGRVTVNRKVSDIQRLVGATPDNKYGSDTTAKVKAWQSKNGLVPDGWWGPASDAKGFPKKPSGGSSNNPKSATVLNWRWTGLQRMLKSDFGYRGRIDNKPGAGTIQAFQRFMNSKGYSSRAIGRNLAVDGGWGTNEVKALQVWLKTRWGYTGNIDGVPGPGTATAFSKAEVANGQAYARIK